MELNNLDMWHMLWDETSLKIWAPKLLQFVCNDLLKIWKKRVTKSMHYLAILL